MNYRGLFGGSSVLEVKFGTVRASDETFAPQGLGPASYYLASFGIATNNPGSDRFGSSDRDDASAIWTTVWTPGGRLGSHEFKGGVDYHRPTSTSDSRFTGRNEDVFATGVNPIAPDYGLADTFDGGASFTFLTADSAGLSVQAPSGLSEYRSLGAVENSHEEWGVFVQDRWQLGRFAIIG